MDSPDYTQDTPNLGRRYCPACEPEADVMLEILETSWCGEHLPSPRGAEDDNVVAQSYLSGSAESGGEDARRMCELIHRGDNRVS